MSKRVLILSFLCAMTMRWDIAFAADARFEVDSINELFTNGWQEVGAVTNKMSITSYKVYDGSRSLLLPGAYKDQKISKTFFDQTHPNTAFTVYWFCGAPGYSAQDSYISLISGSGPYIVLRCMNTDGTFVINLSGSSYVEYGKMNPGWNKINVVYTDGTAAIYLNDSLKLTDNQAAGLSVVNFGRAWSAGSDRNVCFDGIDVAGYQCWNNPPITEADLNGDCLIDLNDQVVMAQRWLDQNGTYNPVNSGLYYEDFEYGNWSMMQNNGWWYDEQIGIWPFLSSETSCSKQKSVAFTDGMKSLVRKTFFVENRDGVDVSIRQYKGESSQGQVAVGVYDVDGNFVLFYNGYDDRVGEDRLQALYNVSGDHNRISYDIYPPTGWNKVSFVFNSDGSTELCFNDQLVETTNVLNGFCSIALIKAWSTFGETAWDGLSVSELPVAGNSSDTVFYTGDLNNDGIVNLVDMATLSANWLETLESKNIYSKPFRKLNAVVVDGQTKLTFYKSNYSLWEGRQFDPSMIQVFRKQITDLVWRRDFEEFADGMQCQETELIYEGPITDLRGIQYSYTDSAIQLGSTYAYWVSVPNARPAGPAIITYRNPNVWWSQEKIYTEINQLQADWPSLVTQEVIGKTVQGKDIIGVSIGNASTNIMMVGAIHAGESGPEIILSVIRQLLQEHPEVFDTVSISAIPVVNFDQRQRSAQGVPYYLRTNANNVDLNRNFPADWEIVDTSYGYCTDDEFALTYRGPYPASEPEVQAVMAFIQQANPSVVLSYHHLASVTGRQFLAASAASGDTSYGQQAQEFFEIYGRGYLYLEDGAGISGAVTYSTSSGSLPCWCYKVLGIPAFDVEWPDAPAASFAGRTDIVLLRENQKRHASGILNLLVFLN